MKKIILFLFIIFISGLTVSYGQCTNERGFLDFPFTQSGVTVSMSGTGSYTNYGSLFTSCLLSTKPNSILLGGGPGTFTNTFSTAVNSLVYNITGADAGDVLSITANTGTTSITYIVGNCPGNMGISGNVMSFTGSNVGGRITVQSTLPFTAITFSLTGAGGGILATMCADALGPACATDVNQPANQSVCNGASTAAVNFTSTFPGTTFSWVNNDPSIGLAASGTGNTIPSFTAINAGAVPVVATVTVTPSLSSLLTQTFNYTGSIIDWIVPAGVTSVNISTKGAQGGNSTYNGLIVGGRGALISGDFTVIPGETLKILVGQHPADISIRSAGGGGGSFVWKNTGNVLLTAAGGGGGSVSYPSQPGAGLDATITLNGTAGTFNSLPGSLAPGGTGGNGGGAIWEGAGGAGWLSNGTNGTGNCNQTFGGNRPLTGGAGGAGGGGFAVLNGGFGGGGGGGSCWWSAGGGGGYSGGAGAGGNEGSGGGGGSFNGGTSQVNTAGFQTGNGQIVITYTGVICSGATKSFTITVAGVNNWIGTTSNNWFTPANWSCGTVPVATTNVVIPTGTPYPCVIASGTAQVRNLTINAGATLTNNGTLNVNGGGVVTTAGTYRGTGSFTGAVYNNNGGIVAPGNSPGCTVFGAGYTNGSGTEQIEIAGLVPCILHDQLQVTGTATLSGTLDVQLFGGFIPSCGQSYKIMTSTALVGTFATINYPALPAGLAWGIQYNLPNPGDVTLIINDVQPPVITCPAPISVNNTPGNCTAVVTYSLPTVTDNCAVAPLIITLPWTGAAGTPSTYSNSGMVITTGSHLDVNWPMASGTGLRIHSGYNTNWVYNAGQPFTPVSVNRVAGPMTFTAQPSGAVFTPGAFGVVNFPNTPQWTNITSMSWTNTGGGDADIDDFIFNGAAASYTLTQTAGIASGGTFPLGVTTNTFMATDASGNSASCSFTVTVVDNEPPVITCPAPISVNNTPGNCSAVVTYSLPTVTDNCPAPALIITLPWTGAAGTPSTYSNSGMVITTGSHLDVNWPMASGTGLRIHSGYNTNWVYNAGQPFTPVSVNRVAGPMTFTAQPSGAVFTPGAFGVVNFPNTPQWTNITSMSWTNTGGGDADIDDFIFNGAAASYTLTQTSGIASGGTFPVGVTTNVFTATDANGNTSTCSFNVTVVDNQNPVITCPANITVCGSQAVTYSTPTATDNCSAVVTQIAGLPSGSVFPVGTTINTYRATDPSGNFVNCSFNVIVNPIPTATALPSSQIVCSATPITIIVLSGSAVPGTVYNWTRDNIATVTGIAASGAGNISGTLTNTTNTPITVTFTITPTANGCPGTPVTATVLVAPMPILRQTYNGVTVTANNDGTDDVGNFAVCSAPPSGNVILTQITDITNITPVANVKVQQAIIRTNVTFPASADGIYPITAIGPIPLSRTATLISPFVSGTVEIRRRAFYDANNNNVIDANECVGDWVVFNITVNPVPDATATPAAQTTCSGAAITTIAITGNVVGTVFNWTRDNPLVTGIANSGAGDISGTLTNASNVPVTVTFTITPSYTNAGGTCTGTPITATVVVNPTPTVNAVANQILCNGAPTTAITFTGAVTNPPGTVFSWTNNNTSIGLAASGTGNIASFTATNTGTAPVVATITVTPSYTNAGTTCTGTPVIFTITVNPTGQVNQPASQILCNGDATAPVNFTTTTPGTVFNWTNTAPSIGLAASGTGNIASFTATNATNAPVVATVTVTPVYTPAVSATTTFNFTGAMQTFTVPAGVTSITVDAMGAQGMTNALPDAVGGNGGRVQATISVVPGEVLRIMVGQGGTQTTAGGFNGGANAGAAACVSAAGGGGGGSTDILRAPYTLADRIVVSAGGGGAGGSRIQGCGPGSGGGGGGGYFGGGGGGGYAGSGGGGGTPAVGGAAGLTGASSSGGGDGFAGTSGSGGTGGVAPANNQSSNWPGHNGGDGGNTTGATGIPGGQNGNDWTGGGGGGGGSFTVAGATGVVHTQGFQTGNGQVVISYLSPGGTPCPGTPVTFTYTVNPTPNAVATPASQTICSGATITTIAITGNVTGTVYNWTRDNTVAVTGIAASGAGNISGALTNTTLAPVTVTFTITPIANGCPGTPITATVVVNPIPNAVATPASQTICSGSAITPIVLSSTGGPGIMVITAVSSTWTDGVTFQLVDASSTTVLSAGPFGFGVNYTSPPITATNPPYTFNIQASITDNFANWAITCNSNPLVNGCIRGTFGPACATATGSYSLPGINCLGPGVAGTTYNWVRDNPIVTGIAMSGSGNISGTLTNPTNSPITVTFTITPIANGCPGTPITATVVVNPIPTVNAVANQVLCNGSPTTAITFTGAVTVPPGTVYNWTNTQTSIGLAASGTGNIASFIATNAGTTPVVASITVTPTYTNAGVTCSGTPITFTITVNPTPNATATPASQTICSGSAITTIVNSGTVPGTVFNWTRDNPIVTGIAASGSGNISGTLTNLTNTPIIVTFTITPSYTNAGVTCSGTPITATVEVNPIPDVNQPANQVVCNGAPTAPVIFTGSVTAPPGTVFNWTNSDPSIGLAASGVGNIASFNAINAGTAPVVATVVVTPSYTNGGGGPGSATFNFTGGIQTFTVPAGVTSINITALGAQGGSGAVGGNTAGGGAGGLGASATGTLAVTPGQVLNILVGGQGATPTGGFNGGGNGGNQNSGGGGGASDVRAGGSGVANRVITAGGGGGGGRGGCDEGAATTGGIGGTGGTGGGGVGNNGGNSPTSGGVAGGGFGGNAGSVQGAFGAAGIGCGGFLGAPGSTTATEIGANGGNGQTCCCFSFGSIPGGGGGGGGQIGGGGAGGGSAGTTGCSGNSKGAGGGGGGGSSFIGGVTAGVTTAGVQSGNGQVVITYIAGTTCVGPSKTFTYTVNPTATVGVPANAVVCNGTVQNTGTYNFTTTATGGTVTYNWVNNNITIGLGGSGTGNSLPTFTATNIGFAPITGTITVTPTFTNGGVSCVGTPNSFTITVNPTPNAVATPASQAICNATAITTIVLTGNVPGTVFNWTRDNGTIFGAPVFGIAASGSGNISGTLTNATNAPVTVTFTITPSYTNGGTTCLGTPITATVLVNPTPNAVALPANQTICSANPIIPIVITGNVAGTVFNWTRDNTVAVTGIAASGAGDISGTLTNTTNAPVTVTFTIIPTYTNGGITCTGATVLATVIVNPTPNAVATPASQTICSGNAITPILLTGNVAGTVFNWTRDNTGTVTGTIAASGVGDIIGTLVNTTLAPITVTFTITPEANGCFGTPITATVLVNPTPNATAAPVSQTICSGSAITPIVLTGTVAGTTFTWTRDNLVDVTGIPASGSGSPISGTLTNSITSTAPELVTFTIIPSANGCAGPAITATVLVNPIPNAVATPASQAVCSGIAITPIILSGNVVGTIFNWTRDNTVTVTGIAASGVGDIIGTLTNTTTAPITVTFTITPSFTNGGVTCTGPSITATVVVNPTPTAAAAPASQTVCTGLPITTIVFTGTVSGTTYNWTRDNTVTVTGIPANGSGNISGTLVNTTLAPVLVTFTITPTANGCAGAPITATVLVNPAPNAVATPSSQTICSGTAITTIVLSGSIPGTVFNWTRNNNATVSGIAASGSGNISGTLTSINPFPITVTFTITPTTGGCVGTPIIATVLVNPTPVVSPVSNKVFCNGVTTPIITFNGTPGSTYNWTNSNTGIGLAASGTGDILPFVTTNATNGPIVATITVTPVIGGCPGLPVSFTITVNPTPIVNPVASQIVCNGTLTAIINFTSPTTGPTGSLSFAWVNSEPSIGLAANGTGNIPPFTAINTGLSPITAIITVTPVYNNGGITCTGASQTFIIVVNPTPTVNPVANQVLCVGSAIQLRLTLQAVYLERSTTGPTTTPSIGLAAAGAGNIASFTTINAGTTPQVATITVTPNFSNTITCPGTPITFTITVNPIPSVNPVANQVVCAGATVTQAFSGPVAGTVYNWTNSNTAIGLAASGSGNLNFVSTNVTGAPLTGTITVTPIFTNGGGTCTGTPLTFTITVNPIPTVNAVASQVVCNNTATASVNFTGAVAGTVYNWTNSNTSIGLAAAGTGNIASFVATNATAVVQTATITVTPIFTNGGVTCTGTSTTFTIMVNPTPTVNTIANQTVCNGTATAAVTITGPVAGTVYNWSNNNISIGLGASGTNTIPSFTAINTGSTPVTATITVTPTFTNGGVSCTGPASTFTITVNPTAVVNQPANQLLCNGASTAAVVFSGLPPGSTYNWTNSNTAIGLGAAGTGNIPSFVATNGTAAPITAVITVTPSSTGCGGTPVSFTITVNPTPSVNAIANQTLCAGATTAPVTLSGPVVGTVYTWTNSNTTIGLGASGIGNIPAFMTVNPTINPVTATITVTPTFTNGGVSCTGNPVSFTITVNPLPNIIFINVPPRVCLTDTLVTLTATPGGTWSGTGVSGTTFSAAAAGIGVHRVTYTATNGFGCTTTRFANIVVNDCIERHNVFQQAIRIWPNPNNGRFSLQFNSDKYKEFKVKIVNARAQEMAYYEFKNLVYAQILPFDLSRLAAGTYFVYVYNTQESGVFPIVIVH